MHCMGTTLRLNDHCLYLNSADCKGRDTDNNKMEQRSQELDWDMHVSCMHFHSLPSSRVIPVETVFDPQNQVDVSNRNLKGQGTLCEQCWHGVRARIPNAFERGWLIFFLLVWNFFLYPRSLHWRPIRFERMATVLITDCVHTPGDCTRAPSRWCASNHPRVPLSASTPSHLFRTRRQHCVDHWSKLRSKSHGGGHFFGTMRKKICPGQLCQTV